MRLIIVSAVLALCFGATVLNHSSRVSARDAAASGGELAVGQAAPNWTLSDAKGRSHSLSDYRGKVIVLDFWASWCAKCAGLMPELEKLHQKYKDKGVVVLGVNLLEDGTNDPVKVMRDKGMTYRILLKGDTMASEYGVKSVPAIYVIGADGKVLYFKSGADHSGLADVIERSLPQRKS